MKIKTIEFTKDTLKIIDQRKLPLKLEYLKPSTVSEVEYAIKTLAVRGAPAIGVAAAFGVYIGVKNLKTNNKKLFFKSLDKIVKQLKASRPTAVNLFWALDRMNNMAKESKEQTIADIKKILLKEAKKIQAEDASMCRNIGKFGASLIKNKDVILTHCNAGALATAGIGTALSPMYTAKQQGKKIAVFADETRPLLQGSRLTAWELRKSGIDVIVICDNMAAPLIKMRKIKKIMVGADRVAANGDFANKIGTYGVAVLAKFHKIPFYVLAPSSTFDFNIKNGKGIPIEQRDPEEVRKVKGNYIAPKKVKIYNPAFDVTPNEFVTAFITEKGIFKKPYRNSLNSLKS